MIRASIATTVLRSLLMHTQDELFDLTTARRKRIPRRPNGSPVNPSTVWRWIRNGLDGGSGERIKLRVTYVGNRPHVTQEWIDEFFEAITEAKLERHCRTEERAADVTDEDLEAAGLM